MNKKLKIWKRLRYKSIDLFLTRRSGMLCRASGKIVTLQAGGLRLTRRNDESAIASIEKAIDNNICAAYNSYAKRSLTD